MIVQHASVHPFGKYATGVIVYRYRSNGVEFETGTVSVPSHRSIEVSRRRLSRQSQPFILNRKYQSKAFVSVPRLHGSFRMNLK